MHNYSAIMANIIKQLSENVSGLLGMADENIEMEQMRSDRVAVGGAVGMTMVDQGAVTASIIGRHVLETVPSAIDKPGDITTQASRFFLVATATWNYAGTGRNLERLTFQSGADSGQTAPTHNGDLDVFKALLDSTLSVSGMSRFHAYLRSGIEVAVEINPTQFQMGALLIALCPMDFASSSIGGYCCFPHIILNCNVNNCGRVSVPWMSTRGMYELKKVTSASNPTPWVLRAIIISPLLIGTGSPSYVDVVVFARFTDPQFHGLNPLSQINTHGMVNIGCNFNVINMSNADMGELSLNLGLAGDVWKSDPGTAAGCKLESLSQWCRVPGLVAQIDVKATWQPGTIVAIIPTNPYYYTLSVVNDAEHVTGAQTSEIRAETPIGSIASKFCFWRGDLCYQFQVICTKFHSCRLLVSFFPGTKEDNTAFAQKKLALSSATSTLCAAYDVNGIGSTMNFRVPWVSNTPWKCNPNFIKDHVVGSSTGVVVISVLNRVTYPTTVEAKIKLLVWLSSDNIQCHAPIYSRTEKSTMIVSTAGDDVVDGSGFDSGGFVRPVENSPVVHHDNKGIDGIPVGAITTIEDPTLQKKKVETFPEDPLKVPLHSNDHMLIRNFFGRAYYYDSISFTETGKYYSLPITFSTTKEVSQYPYYIWRWAASLWHLLRGPIRITITLEGEGDVDCMVAFIPEGSSFVKNDGTMTDETDIIDKFGTYSSVGLIHWNTLRTDTIQFDCPWYNPLHAITGAAKPGPDSNYGRLGFYVKNLAQGRETTRLNIFLSFTPETEVYFMRSPCSPTYLGPQHPKQPTMLLHPDIQTLEDWIECQALDDESRAKGFRGIVQGEMGRPYKDLRVAVGAHRLVYAVEDLQKPIERDKLYTQSGVFENGEILVADDSGWNMKGVYVDGVVYYVDCSPRMCSSYPSLSSGYTAKCDISKYNWTTTGQFASKEKAEEWAKRFRVLYFDYTKFCSGDIRGALHNDKLSEELVKLFQCMTVKQPKTFSRMVDDTDAATKLKYASESVNRLAKECSDFIKDVRAAVTSFERSLQRKKRTIVVKVVYSVVKCAVSIYVCSKGQWRPGVVLGVLTMLGMDVCSAVSSLEGIFENMFEEVAQHIGIKKQAQSFCETQSLSMRDVAAAISVAKGLKDIFGWLISALKNWYDKNYGEERCVLEYLDDQKDAVDALVSQADVLVAQDCEENEKTELKYKCMDVLRDVRTLQSIVSKHETLKPLSILLRDTALSLQRKISGLGGIRENVVVRPEPVVVYMFGDKGSGKSLSALCLAVKLCKALGVEHEKNIYTKPVGAEFWDGYTGQLVVIMDDIGQETDDEDWKGFCQLVSGCPMRVDMADLSSKGQHFNSPIIIATSNLANPQPRTVYCQEAIERRLHFKVKVQPSADCTKSLACGAVLDIKCAEARGKLKDMSCCDMTLMSSSVSIEDLVHMVLGEVKHRDQTTKKYMDLWAQSADKYGKFIRVDGEPSGRLDQIWGCVDHSICWILGSVIALFGLAAVVYGVTKLVQKDEVKEEIVENRAYHGTGRPKAVVHIKPEQQSQSILEIANVAHHNLCRFGIEVNETVHWVLNCIGVYGNWVIVPYHAFAYDFEEDDDPLFFIQRGLTYYSFRKSTATIMPFNCGHNDVVLMHIPQIPPFKDIRHHFIQREQIPEADGKVATLATINNCVFQMISEGEVKYQAAAEYIHRTKSGKETSICIGESWRGTGFAYPGSCGGVLITSSTRTQNAIIGVHVAAGGGVMISTAITRDMFDIIDSNVIKSQRILAAQFEDDGPHINCKSQFKPSPIHDWVPSNRAPSAMPYVDSRPLQDPISMAIEKFNQPIVDEPPHYKIAVLYYQSEMFDWLRPKQGFLTQYEAIMGTGSLEGIDMTTSPGLPYSRMGLRKKDLIDNGVIVHSLLSNNLSNALSQLQFGSPVNMIYQASMKDELRPIDKVRDGKTRTIEGAPVEFVIAVRMILGHVAEAFIENPGFKTMVAIGIDPEADWHPMMTELLRFGGQVLNLDYKGFDSTVQPWMLEHGLNVLCNLAGIDHLTARGLVSSYVVTKRAYGNLSLVVWGGVPSGCPMTSLLDSVINCINIIYVLWKHCDYALEELQQEVRLMTYGDDVILVARKPERIKVNDFVVGMKLLGMNPTSADKGCEIEFKPLTELKFLKRGWRQDSWGLIHPLIEKDTVNGLLKYKRKKAKFLDNIYDACRFMYHYGEEQYWDFVFWLRDLLLMAGLDYTLPRYDALDKVFKCIPHYRNMSC